MLSLINDTEIYVPFAINNVNPKEEFSNIKFKTTYGADTKSTRMKLNLPKTHANNAYCIGVFHPHHKTKETVFKKKRRNDRKLQKFYDAEIIGTRDGEVKKGSQLSSGRTSRGRYDGENLRVYRGRKKKKGFVTIRRGRAQLPTGSKVLFPHDGIDEPMIGKGTHKNNKRNTTNVEFTTPASNGQKSASINKIRILWVKPVRAWEQVK